MKLLMAGKRDDDEAFLVFSLNPGGSSYPTAAVALVSKFNVTNAKMGLKSKPNAIETSVSYINISPDDQQFDPCSPTSK